ncbi:MAG: FHA domain-containing protein [Thermoguttaceae bacterium]
MTLVLYDMLLNLKYPIPDKDIVIYGKEGGKACDVYVGTNRYDETRTIDDEEKIVMNFVLASISHQHFIIDRRGAVAGGKGMVVKDLSRNGTYVSLEGGEFVKVARVVEGNYDSVAGISIQLGSRIRLGSESDHRLEVMTDAAASGVIEAFVSVRELMNEQPEAPKAKKKAKKGFFGIFGR